MAGQVDLWHEIHAPLAGELLQASQFVERIRRDVRLRRRLEAGELVVAAAQPRKPRRGEHEQVVVGKMKVQEADLVEPAELDDLFDPARRVVLSRKSIIAARYQYRGSSAIATFGTTKPPALPARPINCKSVAVPAATLG